MLPVEVDSSVQLAPLRQPAGVYGWSPSQSPVRLPDLANIFTETAKAFSVGSIAPTIQGVTESDREVRLRIVRQRRKRMTERAGARFRDSSNEPDTAEDAATSLEITGGMAPLQARTLRDS